ncbi:hypothetical protein ADL26_20930, partial [Thermoactinomyces vulgaris]
MRAADEVHPEVFDHRHVAPDRRAGARVAPTAPVLVDVGAVEVEAFTVEEEPAVGGELEAAEAELGPLRVPRDPFNRDRGRQPVPVRLVGVPQDRARHGPFE